MQSPPPLTTRILNAVVIVSALGYFIDIYDYYIFLVTRIAVLKDFGFAGAALTDRGLFLVNAQFAGLLFGGIVFGMLGDRLGRKQSLLGSILVYSLATLASGLTTDFTVFTVLRFIAGFGIAGEVGVGVTLISETMHRTRRSYGVIIFTAIGLLGVVAAGLLSQWLDWRTCYLAGGVAGLLLLLARAVVIDSGMFIRARAAAQPLGSLRRLFGNYANVKRYCLCILLAVPVFFGVSIVMTFAPELGAAMGATEPVDTATTMIFAYLAMVTGEIVIGLCSQKLQSRRLTLACSLSLMALVLAFGLQHGVPDANSYYVFAALIGGCMGYWVNFIALAAEQFGTNLRATAATTIPNFARGATILINLVFGALKSESVLFAAGVAGFGSIAIALIALALLPETYGRDLDYIE